MKSEIQVLNSALRIPHSAVLLITFLWHLHVTAAEPLTTTEPLYKGKPVAYWMSGLEPGRSLAAEPKQAEAETALHALGSDALPQILRFSAPNRALRLDLIRRAYQVLEPEADVKLIDALTDPDPLTRETALLILPKSALNAAMDDIIKALADPIQSVRNAAVTTLVRLAPEREETIAALVEALHDTHRSTDPASTPLSREDALAALAALGAKAKAALPEITQLLSADSDDIREAAAIALWKIDRTPTVVPLLVERLDNARDYQTCVRVMHTLAEIGPPARSATPVLLKKINDPGLDFVPRTTDLTQLALETLAKIDPSAAANARKNLKPFTDVTP